MTRKISIGRAECTSLTGEARCGGVAVKLVKTSLGVSLECMRLKRTKRTTRRIRGQLLKKKKCSDMSGVFAVKK